MSKNIGTDVKDSITIEIEELIKKENLQCSVKDFPSTVNWKYISMYQKLSESFIEKFANKVDWNCILTYQKLTESFIEKYSDKVNWICISAHQNLSESFIEKHSDSVNWYRISKYQNLSTKFKKKFKKKLDLNIQNKKHKQKTEATKLKEITKYAKKHNLKFDGKYLIAFRNHDKNGCGIFNKTISYKKGKYYCDWHVDMDKDEEASFGLGIFPVGNTKVKVKVEDWGVEVNRRDGKGRVWGFEVV